MAKSVVMTKSEGGTTMRKLLIALCVVGLALPASAVAGGWATVSLSSTPAGTKGGGTWVVDVKVLQHGRTALEGVKPTVTIRKQGSGERRVFGAEATGRPGVYRAEVEFPSAGTWSYSVYDGFTQYGGAKAHTFAPVTIGPGEGDRALWTWLLIAGSLAAGLAAALYFATRVRRARVPVPARL